MSPSLRPVPFAVLAAIVGAGALIVYLVMREPSAPAPPVERPATMPVPGSDSVAVGAARPALARGNAAFRAGRYAEALGHYRTAAGMEPASAAPQFGILMAARKLDDAPLADSALAAIQALTDTTAPPRAAPAAPAPAGGPR